MKFPKTFNSLLLKGFKAVEDNRGVIRVEVVSKAAQENVALGTELKEVAQDGLGDCWAVLFVFDDVLEHYLLFEGLVVENEGDCAVGDFRGFFEEKTLGRNAVCGGA